MGIPGQRLPNWGGALGALADAIRATSRAVENTASSDDRVNVDEAGDGSKRIWLSLNDSGGNGTTGELPGGSVTVVTGVSGAFSVTGGNTLTLTLTLSRKTVTLHEDGTLSAADAASVPVTIAITGADCGDA